MKRQHFLIGSVLSAILSAPCYAGVLQYHPNSPAYMNGNFDPTKPGSAFVPCLVRSQRRSADKFVVDDGQPGTITGPVIAGTPPAAGPPAATAMETRFFIRSVKSRHELYNYLNVSASVSGSYGFFSGDASYGLEKETNFEEDVFSWIVYGYSNYGRFILTKVELNTGAKAVASNPVAFRNLCGTDFVSQEVRAVQAAAVFKVRNLTNAQRSVLTASLSGGFNNGVLDVGGSASYTNFIKSAAKFGQIEVNVYALGGPGITALAPIITKYEDPAAVLKTLQDYFQNLTVEQSVPVSYNTGSIQSLVARPQIETDFFNRYIADLWMSYEDVTATKSRLREVLKQSDDYSLTEKQIADVNKSIVNAGNVQEQLSKVAYECRDAFIDVARNATSRRTACTKPNPADSYTPSFTNLQRKPYRLSYWTAGTLNPGEEVISFEVLSPKLQNVTIMKQMKSPAPTSINNVTLTTGTDGTKRAGDVLLMSQFTPTDYPIGLKIQMESGNTYTEEFVYTPSPPVGVVLYAAPFTLPGPSAQDAFEKGDLVPPAFKEPIGN